MDEKILKAKPLYELRIIARNIGVKKPTCYNKEVVIQKILNIELGIDTPIFTTKGRTPYNTTFNVSNDIKIPFDKITKINKIILKAKKDIIEILLNNDT